MRASELARSSTRPRRWLSFSCLCALSTIAFGVVLEQGTLGCGDAALAPDFDVGDGAQVRRDGALVDPLEAGSPALDGNVGVTASCARYCDLVMSNCKDEHAQYASNEECLAFCSHLPLTSPMPQAEDKQGASVACRQYWADSPARTSPKDYCLAAGPFGAGVCGDRCTAYCSVVLSACPPDGGAPVYATQPECATACAAFAYVDAGADGGGEDPGGPDDGKSLNCRLYHLRSAAQQPAACALLADAGPCD